MKINPIDEIRGIIFDGQERPFVAIKFRRRTIHLSISDLEILSKEYDKIKKLKMG